MSNSPDLNNFIHRLPGGFLRDVSLQNKTMDLVLEDRVLQEDRKNHSDKRLGQTDAEFFAEIDRQIVERLGDVTDTVRIDLQRLGVLKREWSDAFRVWGKPTTPRRRGEKFTPPKGEPPPDGELLACNAELMEKYRPVYEALLGLGYTHDELTS